MRKISIIVPVKNEEENIGKLHTKLSAALKALNKFDYEIIFIDDGSTDNTNLTLKKIAKKDMKTKGIVFRKNFGKAAAISAGTKLAKGDILITLDGDLQDDPSELPRFIEKIDEGYDVVVGWKYPRIDPVSKLFFSKIFNYMTSIVVGLKLHDYNCGFKAYKKEAINNISLYGDLHRYIPAILFWKGYNVCEIKIKHLPRIHGESKYGFKRLFKGFFDLVAIKFTQLYKRRPLLFFGISGSALFTAGGLLSGYLFYLFLKTNSLDNRPLIFLAILLILMGMQLLSLGLLGELFVDSTIKPEDYYSIKEIVN
jgi:glycosyltransferase involved in cell wall biosynthesis